MEPNHKVYKVHNAGGRTHFLQAHSALAIYEIFKTSLKDRDKTQKSSLMPSASRKMVGFCVGGFAPLAKFPQAPMSSIITTQSCMIVSECILYILLLALLTFLAATTFLQLDETSFGL